MEAAVREKVQGEQRLLGVNRFQQSPGIWNYDSSYEGLQVAYEGEASRGKSSKVFQAERPGNKKRNICLEALLWYFKFILSLFSVNKP